MVPTAKVELEGRTLELALTLGAIRRIKQTTGLDLHQLGDAGVDQIGVLIWSLIRRPMDAPDPEAAVPSLVEIEETINPADMNAFVRAINDLVAQSTPKGKSEAAAKPNRQARRSRSISTSSGPSGASTSG